MKGRAMGSGLPWSWDELLEIARAGLESAAREFDLEQAVRGIDALDETAVHPILAGAYAGAGLGVFREWPLPGPDEVVSRNSERERCDLVLTARASDTLEDPMVLRREREEIAGTLFAGAARDAAPRGVAPEDAAWIEVKVVGQFAFTSGVPGPSRAYGVELTGALRRDLAKLSSEERVVFGVVLLVLFTQTRAVAEHDVPVALHRCVDAGLPLGPLRSAGFAITDRIGNGWCSVWAVPVR